MSEEQRCATWVRNGPRDLMLKCRVRDGNAVLATIEKKGILFHVWSLADNSAGGWKETEYAAMRAVRKALRGHPR